MESPLHARRRDGGVKHQITKGDWPVRGVDSVDVENRQIWFRASGMNPDQDPYFIHYYRIDFDGTGLVAYTEADGMHEVTFSPDRRFYVDQWSRVDLPPIAELRRTADRSLVMELERADASALLATGWQYPEVFVAKGRDGVTDIWGIIIRPTHFDPNRTYPVIESIYAGPHGSHVPKTFGLHASRTSVAELGFIVAQIDGMGTNNRSKAFHDVAWRNIKDAGFPDRILWHQAVAREYEYYDVSRVGIYGGSAAGRTPWRHCSGTATSTTWRSRRWGATTTGWTRSGGTRRGWDGRSGRTTPSLRTWTTRGVYRGSCCWSWGNWIGTWTPRPRFRS